MTNSSAAVVSRHDYRAFGEELGAGVGGRTTGMGFSVADNLRQKFTGQERDTETGLDYFDARYYANTQGRFTSVDPLAASASITNPQSFNRYSYAQNSPYRFADPTGMMAEGYASPTGSGAVSMSGFDSFSLDSESSGDSEDNTSDGTSMALASPPFDSSLEGSPAYVEQKSLAPRPRVSVTAGAPIKAENYQLPNGEYVSGIVSFLTISVTDENGKPLKGIFIGETNLVLFDSNNLGNNTQNTLFATTQENGTIGDLVTGHAEHSNYRLSSGELTTAIYTQLESSVTVESRQTLTLSANGYGHLGTAVYKRTFSNMEGANRRPAINSRGNHVNNFKPVDLTPVTMFYP